MTFFLTQANRTGVWIKYLSDIDPDESRRAKTHLPGFHGVSQASAKRTEED